MAGKAKKISRKRQFLFKPLKRPMPYIGLLLAILIIIFQGTIRKYTADYVGNWLVNSLKDSTGGNYTLQYDFVRFDVFTKELRIQNLILALDTSVTDQETYLKEYTNLIDVSTPLVVLKLESLWELLVNEKLLIAYVGLQEPRIKLVHSEHLTPEEKKANQQEVTEKIRGYLQELEIDSFRVINGALQIELQNELQQDLVELRIGNFSTLLRGFTLDVLDPEKLLRGLYAEQLELEILDQEIILPRLNHRIKFKRLWVSSVDSIIKLDTLQILPLSSADSSLIIDLTLAETSLTGIDFRKVYAENKLDIQRLEINNPTLALVRETILEILDKNQSPIKLPFDETIIHEIRLNNGKINLDLNRTISSEQINVKANNLVIDSSALVLADLTNDLRDFSINATNTIIELPDSIHQVVVGGFTLDAEDSVVTLKNIKLNPIASRRQYNLYKARGVGLITYASIREVKLAGIDFYQAINNQQYLVDSVHILSPVANITAYPYIKSLVKEKQELSFLINNTVVSNGTFNYNKRQFGQNHRTQATGISMAINYLYPDAGKPIAFDNLNLNIRDGFSELKQIGHTLRFSNLSSYNLTDIDIAELTISPDSTSLAGEKVNLRSTDLIIRGFSQSQLNVGNLVLDELSVETLSVQANFNTRRKKSENSNPLQKAIINKFHIAKADLKIFNRERELNISDLSTIFDSLHYDPSNTTRAVPVDFKDLLLTHGSFSFKSKIDSVIITAKSGNISEADSVISFEDITFSLGNKIDGQLDEIYMKGFDRNELLASNGLDFSYLFLDQPQIKITTTEGPQSNLKVNTDGIKRAILSRFSYVKFDSILNRNANIVLMSEKRKTLLDNLNIIIRNYLCDSSTSATDVLRSEEALIKIDSIITIGPIDTVSVQGISLDIINNKLFTGNIDIAIQQKKNHIQVQMPGLLANGFTTSGLLSGDFSLDTIRLFQVNVIMTTKDSVDQSIDIEETSKELSLAIRSLFQKSNDLMYDTLYKTNPGQILINNIVLDSSKNIIFKKILDKLKGAKNTRTEAPPAVVHEDSLIKVTLVKKANSTHGTIDYIGLHNSAFSWLINDKPHQYFSKLNVTIEVDQLILDTLNEFNVYNHIHNLTVKIKDYKLNLADSLNSLSFDEMKLSSLDQSIAVANISLTPRVDKYDYSKRVGYQAGWHNLQNLNLKIEQLDVLKLLSDKIIDIQKISISDGFLDIFKDKELPIPVNQRRPMLQDQIRNINIPINIDSISVDNFRVRFTARLSSVMPEGSLEFYELKARITNLVNIDSIISKNANLNIRVSTKVMNKGLLSANFNFDMGDEHSPYKFDAHLTAMPASDFNGLLEALAFVSIESGDIKDLSLQAEGDSYYTTGNMKFLYNDLKVSTINKKNLKTKGMGKVMKTFFANAFVVKKNNPGFKFFPRDGAMYYERDPQKIIIDYVTKTALSGVVSSIGARNARKDIKKIQKESKKQKDAERKELKKASRRTTA